MNKLVDLQPRIVEKMINDNIVMIDIRREDEWKRTGIIKNSHLLTFFDERGEYDIEKWMSEFEKLVPNKDQTFVLICARANRTRSLGDFLISQGYKNTSHLFGGIVLWQQELRETIEYKI
ncbi:rhodanese-like domain-containing protein [Poseidonibacter antarcticus]|uniref:rhodanese-like domain-containing protein n=1 Tax=Poseidonibacter antarcticus TaxID=2478538 RepID=UPI000EF4BEEF|nr:rhodanese-like domain-containing protein [Poseidonibacter antarcticus]